jgi:hypothetical protein
MRIHVYRLRDGSSLATAGGPWSTSTTLSRPSPAASSWRAISKATHDPEQCPPMRYGPSGCTDLISSM